MRETARALHRVSLLLNACEKGEGRFPPTELFNEGWMLRLLLDAVREVGAHAHPLAIEPGATWFSEALLGSAFRPARRGDPLGEGFTSADAVLGHFAFHAGKAAGLRLLPDARQFVVVEAKMFSGLSPGVRQAPGFNQAARNIACMAEAIAAAGLAVERLGSLGFFVVAPLPARRGPAGWKLEAQLDPCDILATVRERIAGYERAGRAEAARLRSWERSHVMPLVTRLADERRLGVLSWEACIDAVAGVDPAAGSELAGFYGRCLTFGRLAAA